MRERSVAFIEVNSRENLLLPETWIGKSSLYRPYEVDKMTGSFLRDFLRMYGSKQAVCVEIYRR